MQNGRTKVQIVVLALLAGCGPQRLVLNGSVPEPVVSSLPMAMGLRLPVSFTGYVQKEKLNGTNLEIDLGAAQTNAFKRVLPALFARTVMLADRSEGDREKLTAQGAEYVIETAVDSYIYLLPGKEGSDYYSARIGYKLDLLSLDGKVVGSWIFEGYGSVPSRRTSVKQGVAEATQLAIRDACANIAVHLPQQELVRKLLAPADATPTATGGPST